MENSQQDTQKTTEVTILIMRHAESEYNKLQTDYKIANGLPMETPSQEKLRFEDNPKVIDAELTELGVQECKEAQKMLSGHNIKWAISSPLRRAHRTAQIGLEGHPNLENIEFSVNPYFREKLITSGDLGAFTSQLIEEYPKTDFSSVMNSPVWYLDHWGVEGGNEKTKKMKELWSEKQDTTPLIDFMRSISPTRVESNEEIELRVDKAFSQIQDFLREKLKSGNIDTEKLLVVAHRGFIETFIDRHGGQDPKWKEEKATLFSNAEVKEFVVKL